MGRPTILFVDDDPDLLRLAAGILEREGYLVRCARSAEEAAALAFSTFPDLVVTDVMMLGESGYSLCQRLKAETSTRDIPVLFLTCVEGEREAFEAGATGFLSKPLDPRALVGTVGSLLGSDGRRAPLDEALELARQERFPEALELFRTLAEAEAGTELGDWARYHRACLFERLGDVPAAAEAHRELLRCTPAFWRSHDRLGGLCRRANQVDRAMRHYRRSLSLNPAQPDVIQELELLEGIARAPAPTAGEAGSDPAGDPEAMATPGWTDVPDSEAPVAGSGADILVADDDRDLTNLMAMVLEAAGHRVRVVHDGDAALAAVRERKPDLVLLDGLMPGPNGFEVAREIKERACPDRPPRVVLITAIYTKISQRHEAERRYKVDQVVTKPIGPERLVALVAEQLAECRGEERAELVGARVRE